MAIPFLSDISGKSATFTGNITAEGGTLNLSDGTTFDSIINSGSSLTLNFDSDNNSTGEIFRIHSNTTSASNSNKELFKITESGLTNINVMPGHQSEGILRIGRHDTNASRHHDIKSYVSSTLASNYLTFSLHNGSENSNIDVLTLKGDQNVTFEKSADSNRDVASIKHANNDFLYMKGGTAGISINDDGEDTRMILFNSGNVRFDAGTLDSAFVITADTGYATFAGTVDATNYKINGAQGSDGQVLTSTGSGVAWEDSSGGVTGSGVDNRLAVWSGTNSIDSDADFYVSTSTLHVNGLQITSDNHFYRETINSNTGGESWDASNGWHRIIEISGGTGRGKCHFLIQTGGGSGTPCRVEAIVNTAWSNANSTLSILHNSYPNFITDIRVVRNTTTGKAFVDIKGGGEDYVEVTILPDGSTSAALVNFTNVNTLPTGDSKQIQKTITGKIMSLAAGTGSDTSGWTPFQVGYDGSLSAGYVSAATGFRMASGQAIDFIDSNIGYNSIERDTTNGGLQINTGGTASLNILDTGNATFAGKVGIGATATDFHADADDLVVGAGSGNTGITIQSGTGGYGSIFFADGTADDATEKRGQIRYLQGTERMDFHTDNVATAALSLAANGNATFAGTIASGNIDVTGGGGGNGQIDITRTSGAEIRIQAQSSLAKFGAVTNNHLQFMTNDTGRWNIENGGHLIPVADSAYDIGSNATRVRNLYADTLYGDGSNLTGVTVSNADTVDSLHAASFLRSDAADTGTGTITLADSSTADNPLILGSSSQTSYTLQQWQTSAHGTNEAYILAYGAGHGSQAGNFAMKNIESGGEIFFELASSVEPLRMTSTGSTFAGNVNAGTGLRMYTDGSGNGVIYNLGQDKDLYLVGDDGGSGINALVFDMSEGGAATFAGRVFAESFRVEQSNTSTNVAASSDHGIWLKNTSNTDGNFIPISFSNSTGFETARIGAEFQDAGDRNTDLFFMTRANSGSLTEALRIDSSQNATFTGDVRADNIGLGAAATSFGTGVPTLFFKGTSSANGRAGALYFKENDGTECGALYVTDGNDGYGTVLTAYQGSLKLATGSLTGTVLTLDQSNNATFAGNVDSQGYTINESTLQGFHDFQSRPIDADSGMFTVGGHGMAIGYSRAISLWSTTNGVWRSWIGTNLRWDGTNYKRASNHGNNNWGNIAGMLLWGNNASSGKAIEFIIDPPENASGSGEATIGTSLPSGYTALTINNDLSATFKGDVQIDGNFSLTQHIGLTDASIPSWHANVTSSMTYKDQMTLFSRADETYIGQNFYYGGGDAGKSIEAGKATLMRLRRGEINMYFSTASVNADTAVTLSEKFTLTDAGNLTIAGNIGMATGNATGKFAVMSSAVHGSYDFYNNGTSYFNGAVIIDDNLTLNEYIYHQGDTDTHVRFETNAVSVVGGGQAGLYIESAGHTVLQPAYDDDGEEHKIVLGRMAGSNSGSSSNDNPRHSTVLAGYSVDWSGGTRLSNEGFLMWHSGGGWTGNQRHWALTNAYDMGGTGGPKFALLLGNANTVEPTLGSNGALGTNTQVATYWKNTKEMVNDGVATFAGLISAGAGINVTGNIDTPELSINDYVKHNGDTHTYFGFSGDNTYKVVAGGSDRFQITGDVHVIGSTDFAIPAGRKLYLDGQSNTYITESSDGVIDFYGDGVQLLTAKQNGTQSEVVVNEGSGDVDFRVESNNSTHAFFVEAEGAGKVGIGTDETTGGFNVNNSASGSFYSMSNTDSGNHNYTNSGGNGRTLTTNGAGWITDGRDPILTLSSAGNSNSTAIGYSLGLNLYNHSSTNSTHSPLITFSALSESGSYSSVYGAIGGKKTGAGADTNWNTGEIHFWTAGPDGGGSASYMTSASAMMIDATGNVGIGVGSPNSALQVKGTVNNLVAHFGGQNNTNGQWNGISLGYAEDANAAYRKIGIAAKALGDGAARQELHFLVNSNADSNSAGIGDTKMMIDKLGHVGIGLTDPNSYYGDQLVIAAPDENGITITGTGTGQKQYLCFADGSTGDQAYTGYVAYDHNDNSMTFANNGGNARMKIASNGEVGIGTDSPQSISGGCKTLTLGSTAAALSGGVGFQANGTGKTFIYWESDNMRYQNVGDFSHTFYKNNSTALFTIATSGTVTASGDVVAYSDKKLKKNIKTLDGSKVYNMRGVSFTRKDNGNESSGVIAQEIQKIAPELVSETDGTLGVAYGNLTGYLIEAIKDLKAEIEELKSNKCNCNK